MDWQHEAWAEALWVEQNNGDDGANFMAEQITRLALDSDLAGIARWKEFQKNCGHSVIYFPPADKF